MKRTIISILVLVIVAVLGFFLFEDKEQSIAIAEENAVVMGDQKPGEEVVVNYAKLKESGYITIYKQTESGEKVSMGTSEFLPAGEYYNIVINVSSPTVATEKIIAEVVADDGDEIYDPNLDTVVVISNENNEEGAHVSSLATVSEEAPLPEDVNLEELLEQQGYTVLDSSDDINEDSSPEEEMIQENDDSEEVEVESSDDNSEAEMLQPADDSSAEEMSVEEDTSAADGEKN